MSVSIGKSFSIVDTDLVLNLDSAFNGNYILSEVEVLVVAGGGGGGGWGGGGGGGGVLYDSSHGVTPGSAISVTVGSGGARGSSTYTSGGDGTNSVFSTMTAIGGGGGGHYNSVNGRAGGSGGGGGGGEANTYGFVTTGGTGTPGQGNNGGSGSGRPGADLYNPGGGGGGAGEPGYNFDSTFSGDSLRIGGKGGDGLPFNISGKYSYYGGGGGGQTDGRSANNTATSSFGGKGGGGRGGSYSDTYALNGANGTGGGGGGSYGGGGQECGIGGSGVVIVRYPGPQKATGGNTITSVGGYTIHTFTSSGTFTPLAAPANAGAVYGLQDLSGNNNTGTQSGGVLYSSANGGSLTFDGSNDYIDCVLNSGLTGTGSWAMSAWFKINGAPSAGTYQNAIVDTDATGGSANMICADWSGYHGGSQNQLVYASRPSTGGSYTNLLGPVLVQGVWYNATVVRNGTIDTKLYTNGSLSATYTGNIPTATQPLVRIGRWSDGTNYANCSISQVQIYNRALTAAEVSQNFNALRGRFGI